jgi:hypothetical protein
MDPRSGPEAAPAHKRSRRRGRWWCAVSVIGIAALRAAPVMAATANRSRRAPGAGGARNRKPTGSEPTRIAHNGVAASCREEGGRRETQQDTRYPCRRTGRRRQPGLHQCESQRPSACEPRKVDITGDVGADCSALFRVAAGPVPALLDRARQPRTRGRWPRFRSRKARC